MSKTYVAVQRSGQKYNELTHWKYIKREKKNGKWRYYYDRDSLKADVKDKLGYDEREQYNKAKKEYNDAVNKHENARRTLTNTVLTEDGTLFELTSKSRHSDHMVEIALDNREKARRNRELAENKLNKAIKEYGETPLGKIDNMKTNIKDTAKWIRYKLGIY